MEVDALQFNNRGLDSQQVKLLKNLFNRHRVFVRTDSLSGTGQINIPEFSFVALTGRDYKFTLRGSGSFLGNSADVEFSFDYDDSTDITGEGHGVLYVDADLDGTTNAVIIDNDPDVTVTFEGTIDGLVSFEWNGILSVPSRQKVEVYANLPEEQSFTYLELELFELN